MSARFVNKSCKVGVRILGRHGIGIRTQTRMYEETTCVYKTSSGFLQKVLIEFAYKFIPNSTICCCCCCFCCGYCSTVGANACLMRLVIPHNANQPKGGSQEDSSDFFFSLFRFSCYCRCCCCCETTYEVQQTFF